MKKQICQKTQKFDKIVYSDCALLRYAEDLVRHQPGLAARNWRVR
jgi:hypothetical protein